MLVCFWNDKCSVWSEQEPGLACRMLVGSLLYEGQDRKRSVLLTAQPICCRGGRWGRKTGCCRTLRTGQAARGSQAPFEREGGCLYHPHRVFEWESEGICYVSRCGQKVHWGLCKNKGHSFHFQQELYWTTDSLTKLTFWPAQQFPNSRLTLLWATQVKGVLSGDPEARVETQQAFLDRMKHQNTVVSNTQGFLYKNL